MAEDIVAAAGYAVRKGTEGVFSSVNLYKEIAEIVAKLPDDINSPEQLIEYMKILNRVSVKEVNLGIYKIKSIIYKEE